jgi:hypothetical protein
MTITLPDEMKDELERKAAAAGFGSVADYLLCLAEEDEPAVPVLEPPLGARYAVRTREELEAKLLEGLDRSGDVVAGPDFWDQRHRAQEARASGGRPQ